MKIQLENNSNVIETLEYYCMVQNIRNMIVIKILAM